jgi:hypothetical protein
MSELRHALTEYLSLRRSLGYKLRRQESCCINSLIFSRPQEHRQSPFNTP